MTPKVCERGLPIHSAIYSPTSSVPYVVVVVGGRSFLAGVVTDDGTNLSVRVALCGMTVISWTYIYFALDQGPPPRIKKESCCVMASVRVRGVVC